MAQQIQLRSRGAIEIVTEMQDPDKWTKSEKFHCLVNVRNLIVH